MEYRFNMKLNPASSVPWTFDVLEFSLQWIENDNVLLVCVVGGGSRAEGK